MFGMNKNMIMMMAMGKMKKSPSQLMEMALNLEMFGMRSQANTLRKMAIMRKFMSGDIQMPFMGYENQSLQGESYNFGELPSDMMGDMGADIAGLGELGELLTPQSYNIGSLDSVSQADFQGMDELYGDWGD
jgi:hypothetical protein